MTVYDPAIRIAAPPEHTAEILRDRVESAFAQGLASQKSGTGGQQSLAGTVLLDRLHRVCGATRMKAAMLAEQWAQKALIATQHGK